jgi:PAS domain S-box-containing protein
MARSPPAAAGLGRSDKPANCQEFPVTIESLVKHSVRYLVAVIIVSLAAACRIYFHGDSASPPYSVFYPAIILSSLLCGLYPGLLALVLSSLVIDYWWIEPVGSLKIGGGDDWLPFWLFLFNSLLICSITELMLRARRRADLLAAESAIERERRQSTEDLMKQQVLLERMSRLAKVGGWRLDRATMEVEVTGETARIHDIDAGEIVPLGKLLARYDGDCRQMFEGAVGEAMEGAHPFVLKLDRKTQQGETVWVLVQGHPVKQAGTVVGIEGAMQDITEQTRGETALLEMSSFYRQIIDNLGEGIAVHGCDVRYTLWNRFMEEISGIGSHEVIGHHPEEILPLHQQTGVLGRVRQALAGSPPPTIEIPYTFDRSGYSGRFLDKSVQMLDPCGRVTGVINILHDITEQRIIEEKLENEMKFIENAFNNLRDTFLVMDLDGRLVKWNRALNRATGYSDAELASLSHTDLMSTDYHPQFQETIGRVIRQGSASMEGVLLTREGDAIPYEYSGSLLLDKGGEMIGINLTGRDVTERKAMEQQLLHSQKMEAIGTLAGGIAHDFNNLLTVISGYGNLMQMKIAEQDPLRSELDQILAASEKAAFLVNRLLTFSRKLEIHLANVNLPDIVRNLEKFLARIIGEDIQLTVTVAESRLFVRADINQIEQVLMNLATNARDAMPEGGVLSIELDRADFAEFHPRGVGKPGSYARITVRDTGSGIDSITQQHMFEPYFTTKELGKGTGLGLSIVYGIVNQHGGSIQVESTVGEGTRFDIFIPLLEQGSMGDESPPGHLQSGTGTILLAEDEDTVRRILRMMLSSVGYRVIEACDGLDAIEVFRTCGDTIDLLVLDIVMPKMNGMAAYEEIRKVVPDMKVVFMSGYPADVLSHRESLPPHADIIAKPIQHHELAHKIQRLFAADDAAHIPA